MGKRYKKKKRKPQNKAKKPSIFSRGEYEIPSAIKAKMTRSYLVGGAIVIAGLLFAVVANAILMLPCGLLLGGVIVLMQYMKELSLSRNGYRVFEGVCVKTEYKIVKQQKNNGVKTKEPKRFLVKGYNEDYGNEIIYSIPYINGNDLLEDGEKVTIYSKNNPEYFTNIIENNGYISLGGLICYEGLYEHSADRLIQETRNAFPEDDKNDNLPNAENGTAEKKGKYDPFDNLFITK